MLFNIRCLRIYKLLWSVIILSTLCGLTFYTSFTDYVRTTSRTASQYDSNSENLSLANLQNLKKELLRIITSVKNELINLEKRRDYLLNALRESENELNSLRYEIYQNSLEADRYRITLKELSHQQKDLLSQKLPLLNLPLIQENVHEPELKLESHASPKTCDLHQCFNWKLCSIHKHLDLYIAADNQDDDPTIWTNVYTNMLVLTSSRNSACIHLHLSASSFKSCNEKINCLLVSEKVLNYDQIIQYGMLASSDALMYTYRPGFDIVLSALSSFNEEEMWPNLQSILPVARPYLLYFSGFYARKTSWPIEIKSMVSVLKNITVQKCHFDFTCKPSSAYNSTVHPGEWQFCHATDDIVKYPPPLKDSIFCLILSPVNSTILSSTLLQKRLTQCLMASSIPVILGKMILPFEDILPHWGSAVIRMAKARITELELILLSIPAEDIIEMRRQGRLILDRCLGSDTRRARCLHLLLTRRLHLLPPARAPVLSRPISDTLSESHTYPVSAYSFIELDNRLGPVTDHVDSVMFRRNLSGSLYLTTDSLNAGSGDFDPFYRYPSTPWEPVLPPQVQFQDPIPGFRPIDHSINKAGVEFAESLGGNAKYEQFTMIILSHNRLNVLLANIETYNQLPYLHSIIIIWNNLKPPAKSLKWPRLNVPIRVIHGPNKNSLNNRFVPYDLIRTDAVLSLDDDVDMRQDEIILAFRTWRENRDRLVGFPARFHTWNNVSQQWEYQSSRTCEFSMILTGAAFFHKYYMYAYSFVMPASIRELIDTYMNCEDIAFNFLVAHITRKPPIKVTSRWTFYCSACKNNSLYQRPTHFHQRSACINYLSQVYGYNPLLYTQFRADSILFKTRLPADKQKCFKYV